MQKRGRFAVVGLTLISLSLFASCASSEPTARSDAANSGAVSAPSMAPVVVPAPSSMPDLTGTTEEEARKTLRSIGVDGGDISVTKQESLLQAGTVIDHIPGSQGQITGSITLIIAQPVGPVPDFTGQQVSIVKSWATERKIELQLQEVLNDSRNDGEVIATTPSANQEATSQILVDVSRMPTVMHLSEMKTVGDSCNARTGEWGISGRSYPNSISKYKTRNDTCVFEYNLSRDWERFKADFGLADDSDSDAQFRFEIAADNRPLESGVVGLGEPVAIDEDVSGVLRLTLRISLLGPGVKGTAVWGTARLIGSPPGTPSQP